jgi:microcin C transport system substrate-binding protein
MRTGPTRCAKQGRGEAAIVKSPTRRTFLALTGALAAAAKVPFLQAAWAAPNGRHGMSLFGDLGYKPGFAHFDYVNPNAPKDGRIVMLAPNWAFNQNPQTFNTLNSFVTRGDAPPRMELTFDALMVRALDEPDAVYGLVAEAVELSENERELVFFLRDNVRFRDGSALTAEDVVFSLNTFKERGHPAMRLPLGQMASAEAKGSREVVVGLSPGASRELKLVVAGLPIVSKAYYEEHDFDAATMQPPLGSGPYRVGRFSSGRYIEYERVPDYWGADLAVNRGRFNFDVIRIEFFRDRTAEFEALKKGDLTYREEFTAKTWATEYDFPAVQDGRLVQETVPAETVPDFQAWYFNTRRPKFADPRTRQAIGLAFDFEWTNQNIFFGAYERSASFFERSMYAAAGEPSPAELELLQPFRDELPPEVFAPPPVPPVSDGSGRDRENLREALQLLAEAGWERRGGEVVDANGRPLTVEFLINSPTFERVLGPYADALRAIGITASIRLVDPAQYQSRQNGFEFDIITARAALSATPLEGLRTAFTSEAAETPGTRNFAGVSHPAVDALVEAALTAPDRDSHQVALMALDRVLRVHHYVIPQWYSPEHRVAMWDLFDRPAVKPDFGFPVETTWWYDADKARRTLRQG